MALIVQKFGGTSVADERAREFLAAKAEAARKRGDKVVLVVSAMGRRGAPYATDTLLDLVGQFGSCADAQTRDLLASCGETISACLVASFLTSRGTPAVPLTAYTAGIKAEGPYGDATPTAAAAARITALLDEGKVPVVTGFQGVNADGQIATLGRGGSDTTAVALGAFLKADYVDIYTDVPGVAAADPRVIPEAPFLDYLDYRSMYRLATHGARVLHDRSAQIAEQYGVRVRVRSTFDDLEGTLLGPERPGVKEPDFLGIAFEKEDGDKTKVTVLFRSGKGREGIEDAVCTADPVDPLRWGSEDPDVVSFLCPTADAPGLMRKIFKVLA
jgi:aspartate kinase